MKDFSLSKRNIFLLPILILIQECLSDPLIFTCPSTKGRAELPSIPATFTANIRVNYLYDESSVELRHVFDVKNKNRATEFWSENRHVKYVHRDSQLLMIKYDDKGGHTCTVKTITSETNLMEPEDAGPNRILEKLVLALNNQKSSAYVLSSVDVENSMYLKRWETCLKDPAINISLGFADPAWKRPFMMKDWSFLSVIEASDGKEHLTAIFSNFNPNPPTYTEFQPPEFVHCDGYQPDKKPPTMPDYFTYHSEIKHWNSDEKKTHVSNRKVYYDYPALLSKIDFYNPEVSDRDLFSPFRGVSIIHDFNSDIQYIFDPVTGSCNVDSFEDTVGPVPLKISTKGAMVKGNNFFSLDSSKIAYNGMFLNRGFLADVYNGIVEVAEGNIKSSLSYTWYFSKDSFHDDEKSGMKTGLLRMFVRHEADGGYSDVDANFFDFEYKEPDAFQFDLSACYNDSFAKTYVMTFPAFEDLRGSEYLVRYSIHQALKKVMGVRKQRIFVLEVFFSGNYMYAEFRVTDSPIVTGKAKMKTEEPSLKNAISKLFQSLSDETFNISISIEKKLVILRPEPNGVNEFAGERKTYLLGNTYKEGSVIGLTIGMLVLGIILGGITLDLIIGRKFGVSLFRKMNNPHSELHSFNESSM